MSTYKQYVKNLEDSLRIFQQNDDMFLRYYAGSVKISSLSADFLMIASTNRGDEDKFNKAMEMANKLYEVQQAYESMLSRYEFAMNSYKAIQYRCNEMMHYITENENQKELLKQMEKENNDK
jgi:hypothetical protein